MKRILILFSIILTTVVNAIYSQQAAWQPAMNSGCIVSKEHNTITNPFTIDIKLKFADTTNLQTINWKLPKRWTATNLNTSAFGTHLPNDSVIISFSIAIPNINKLPYYQQYLEFHIITDTATIWQKELICGGYVYFTPYNTIEIWNLEDFCSLKRAWKTPTIPEPTRVYIPKSSIPVSDITDFSLYERDSITWNNWWIDNFRERKVDGLAYNVLTSPVPYDSIPYYAALDDGVDSLLANPPRGRTFTGTIVGRIVSTIKKDTITTNTNINTTDLTIGLSGLRVILYEKDLLLNDYFGEAYTDNNGYFSISYSKAQTGFEGKTIELLIKVFAETSDVYEINGKSGIGFTSRYSFDLGEGHSQHIGTKNIGNKNIDDSSEREAFRSVHWANKGFKYFYNNDVHLQKALTFRINSNLPSSYTNVYEYVNNPYIHVAVGQAENENTIYHEFGHYVMYRLQHNVMAIPYGENGVEHSWDEENTSLNVFIEGWACAVQFILDAAYWQEDNEYGIDDGGYYENERNYNKINNGFRSEYYIANALYDLWDGPGKGLPSTNPALGIHGWNDTQVYSSDNINIWSSIDDVELTLQQICAPLKTVYAQYTFKSIGDYYNKLIELTVDCPQKANIARVFRENRVVWNIDDYNNEKYLGSLAIDPCTITKTKSEHGMFNEIFTYILHHSWTSYYPLNFCVRENGSWSNWIYFHAQHDTDITYIMDDYWIGVKNDNPDSCKFVEVYLNYTSNNNSTNPNPANGIFQTCGKNKILVKNGRLELGGYSNNYKANLTVSNESLLRIDSGSQLMVNNNSVLRIAAGGTLCIKNGANVFVRGNGEIIVKKVVIQ